MLSGGGAAFENTPKVVVQGSSLKWNSALEGGAMLFFSSSDETISYQEVIIDRTVVENNTAIVGGGFLARNMDQLSLTVRNCFFESNSVVEGSPMGDFQFVSNVDLIFRNNNGRDFQGFNELCDSIVFAQDEGPTRCNIIPSGRESGP